MALTPLTQAPNFGTTRVAPKIPFPATIANSVTWNSDLLPAGFGAVLFAATADQIVTLEIQRYADLAGAVPLDLNSNALAVATPGWVFATDGLPYLSFVCSIVNASGSLANISNCSILTGLLR